MSVAGLVIGFVGGVSLAVLVVSVWARWFNEQVWPEKYK